MNNEYFSLSADDYEDWQQAEEELLNDRRDEIDYYEHEYWSQHRDDDAMVEAEQSYWNYMYSLVISNSSRLDDTPIFNRLAIEREDWAHAPVCPHGMSPDLCEGPMHYPEDHGFDEPPF